MSKTAKRKTGILLAVLVVGALMGWFSTLRDKTDKPLESVGDPHSTAVEQPGSRVPFDFYLLAMTLHPAFCADGHAREPECLTDRPVPLAIHGLWPERRRRGDYPSDCPGPPLDLEPPLAAELATLMPGMQDRLHEHEWRKHGTCTGLDDDAYYRHTLRLARQLDGVLRDHLTTLAGGETTAAELRGHADRRQPGLGAALTFHCRTLRDAPPEHRRRPFLVEIRQCVDDDGAGGTPGSPLACADHQRMDQGCGRSFRIAALRR